MEVPPVIILGFSLKNHLAIGLPTFVEPPICQAGYIPRIPPRTPSGYRHDATATTATSGQRIRRRRKQRLKSTFPIFSREFEGKQWVVSLHFQTPQSDKRCIPFYPTIYIYVYIYIYHYIPMIVLKLYSHKWFLEMFTASQQLQASRASGAFRHEESPALKTSSGDMI